MSEDIKLMKVAPQSLEAEQSVLGSMILDRDQIAIVVEILSPEHFYAEKNEMIFSAIIELYERNDPVDMITLINLLEKKGILEKIGGAAYLSTLVEGVPTPKSANAYAEIVMQKSVLRDLIKAGNEIVKWGYQEDGGTDELVSKAEKLLYDISKGRAFKDINRIQPVLKQTFDQLNMKYKHRGEVSGLPTGFTQLNQLTSGFQPSDLIVLAARPGMGKTSLALNFCEHMAVEKGKSVGIFSLEMSATQLVTRMLCSMSSVDAGALRKGYLFDNDWPRLSESFTKLNTAPIAIVDSAGISPLELKAKARRMQKEFGVEFIVIDYLQLIVSQGRRPESRAQEVSEITRQLKTMARELNIPVMAISQLSRAVEQRQEKRPQLSDLRDSGSIEQDADLVMFLFRESYYKEQQGDEEGHNDSDDVEDSRHGATELIISKHRNGPTGKVMLSFLKQYTRFEEYTDRQPYS